jgi:hypothetical protein
MARPFKGTVNLDRMSILFACEVLEVIRRQARGHH